jgi:lipopolysaccharide assembly outer membrane protein LptD (OstA)
MFRRPLLVFLALAAALTAPLYAQSGERPRAPLQIEALFKRTEGNLAIAEGNVVIGVGDTVLYCNYAQFDVTTREILVSGNVRIYRGEKVFAGDRAVYNLDTKRIFGAEFRTSAGPFMAQAHAIHSTGSETFEVSRGFVTTDNSSDPGFHLRARKVSIFHNDHTEIENVTLYAGRTPVLWLPYLYQPAQSDQSFSVVPGSRSLWGAFVMTRLTFPVSKEVLAGGRLDYLAKRGTAVGLDFSQENKARGSWARFRSYYLNDKTPGTKDLGVPNEAVQPNRFRFSLQDRSFLSDTIYTSVNFNKVSDINFYRDFSPAELRRDPNPDSVLAVTKLGENHALTLELRKQLNSDYEGSNAMPALSLDLMRQPVAGTGLFYEGETSAGSYRRNFMRPGAAVDYALRDYVRLDTFHQLSLPKLVDGWWAVVPKIGVRATHYGTGNASPDRPPADPLFAEDGAVNRYVVNAGLETSFKLSRVFESVQTRTWGLDGLRHIVQPFANWSWVNASKDPSNLVPLDVLSSSSKLPAIDFPQFNTLDSISSWDIVRFGLRNRLQTRRDEQTLNWLELESFVDARVQRPEYSNPLLQSVANPTRPARAPDPGQYSNVFNRLRWNPLPWLDMQFDTQLPLLDEGYSEVNTASNIQVNRDFFFTLGNRYVAGHPAFPQSNLLNGGARFRMNDNWSMSFEENYETVTRQMQFQRYSIDRDLRSWIASLSLVIRERDARNDIAVLLTLSLKDIPKFRLPLHFDPESATNSSNSKNQ